MPDPPEMARDDVLELIVAAAGAGSGRRCLEAALFRSGAINVYVDGVDEVVPVHKDKALRILELLLQKTHGDARLWVASRLEVEESLRRVLRCTTVSLLPLSRRQQVECLTKQWTSKLMKTTADVEPLAEEIADAVAYIHCDPMAGFSYLIWFGDHKIWDAFMKVLLQHTTSCGTFGSDGFIPPKEDMQKSIQRAISILREMVSSNVQLTGQKLTLKTLFHDMVVSLNEADNSLLQTPFHLKLVAEGFVEDAGDSLKSGSKLLKERFNQLEIFHRFIKFKRNSSQGTHGQTNVNPSTWCRDVEDETFKWIHQMYALKIFNTLFAEIQIPWLQKELEKLEVRLPKEKTGILWESENQGPQFVHFSFVEFFVSTWLHENLNSEQSMVAKDLLQTLLEKGTCGSVLLFLDLMLSKGLRLHQAAMAGDSRALEEALGRGEAVDALDAGGRSALHLAASYGISTAVYMLLANGAHVNLESRDSLMGWTPLQYADSRLRLEVAELLLAAGAARDKVNFLIKTYSAVQTATALDFPEVVHCYLNGNRALISNSRCLENSSGRRQKSRNSTIEISDLLFNAANFGSINVIKKLFEVDSTLNVDTVYGGYTALYVATSGCQVDAIKILISKGAKHSIKTVDGDTAVQAAVRGGNIEVVKILVKSDNIDTCGNNGYTPLHIACKYNHLEVVKYLLHEEANPKAKSNIGSEPIHEAASLDRDDLVAAGADIEPVNSNKETPLHRAAEGRSKEGVNYLSRKANIHARDSDGLQAIHLSVLWAHIDIVNILLDAGADIESVNKCLTPLLYAVIKGYEEKTKFLLSRKANLYARARDGSQAIHYAAFHGHTRIVEILLDKDVNIESVSKHSMTPLHCAVKNGQQEVTKYLLSRGAKVEARTTYGNQAIHYAAFHGHTRIVEILLDKNVNIESVRKYNMTPLHCAAKNGHQEVTKHLLSRGAKVEARTTFGNQAIHFAAYHGHTRIVEILLDADVNIESVSNYNMTPLHLAVQKGHQEVTKYLLSRGANVHARTSDGIQAIDLAVMNGDAGVIEILSAAGAHI